MLYYKVINSVTAGQTVCDHVLLKGIVHSEMKIHSLPTHPSIPDTRMEACCVFVCCLFLTSEDSSIISSMIFDLATTLFTPRTPEVFFVDSHTRPTPPSAWW